MPETYCNHCDRFQITDDNVTISEILQLFKYIFSLKSVPLSENLNDKGGSFFQDHHIKAFNVQF